MRLYNVHGDVIRGHGFAPLVHVTPESVGTRPIVDWQRFHDTVAISRLSERVKGDGPLLSLSLSLSLSHTHTHTHTHTHHTLCVMRFLGCWKWDVLRK
jgi:hypothetical protein